jgi:hypothetical protein
MGVDVALLADAGGAAFMLSAQASSTDVTATHKRAARTRAGRVIFFIAR